MKNFKNTIALCVFLLLISVFTFNTYAHSHHGDDEISFVELSKIMSELVTDIERHNSNMLNNSNGSNIFDLFTYIDKDGIFHEIPQSALSKIFAYQLALHKEALDFHCSGGCHEQKRWSQIYLSRLYKKVKLKKTLTFKELRKASLALAREGAIGAKNVVVYPFKIAYEWGTEEVPELMWKSVGKVRSLGVPFILINAIGEALDVVFIHSLHIPIPFCTVINTASFWISEKVKSFSKLAFKKQDGGFSILRKWKTLSNYKEFRKVTLSIRKESMKSLFPPKRDIPTYKNTFKRKWAKFLNYMDEHRKNYWLKNKERVLADYVNFSSQEQGLERDFQLLDDLSGFRKLINEVFHDQFQTLQSWMDLQSDYYLEMYHEKEINFKTHMKTQWRLGAVENKLHDYKAHVLNLINDPKKARLTKIEIKNMKQMYHDVLNTMVSSSRLNCNSLFN